MTIKVECRWGHDTDPKQGAITLSMDGNKKIKIEVPHDPVYVDSKDFLRAIKTIVAFQSGTIGHD